MTTLNSSYHILYTVAQSNDDRECEIAERDAKNDMILFHECEIAERDAKNNSHKRMRDKDADSENHKRQKN